jgi:hypothetical protein
LQIAIEGFIQRTGSNTHAESVPGQSSEDVSALRRSLKETLMPIKRYQYKRFALMLAIFVCLFVIALAAGARVRTFVRNSEARVKASQVLSVEPKLGDGPEGNQTQATSHFQPALSAGPSSTPLPTFVAPGFRAALESASSARTGPIQAVSITAVNRGNEKLEALDVLLLDFRPQGIVSRVERKVFFLNAIPNAKQSLSFESAIPRDPWDSQILAITAITSEKKRQDVDLKVLAKALANQQAGGPSATVAVAEKGKDEFSPSPCFDWFQLVHGIAGDNNSAVSAFACNQSEQSFGVVFVPKRK